MLRAIGQRPSICDTSHVAISDTIGRNINIITHYSTHKNYCFIWCEWFIYEWVLNYFYACMCCYERYQSSLIFFNYVGPYVWLRNHNNFMWLVLFLLIYQIEWVFQCVRYMWTDHGILINVEKIIIVVYVNRFLFYLSERYMKILLWDLICKTVCASSILSAL